MSPILLATAIYSAAATEANLDFALARIQPGWIVHLVVAATPVELHYCGLVTRKVQEGETHLFELTRIREANRAAAQVSCPKNSQASFVSVTTANLLAVDYLYQAADVFALKENRLLSFRHPMKRDVAITEDTLLPPHFETRPKSRPLVPGRYWPELSITGGYSGFFGLDGKGAVTTQLSSLWFIHPRISDWHIRADLGYSSTRQEGGDYVLPDRLVQTALGISWRFVASTKIILHSAVSAVSVFYRYLDTDYTWAHRPALRLALSFEWALLRADRDVHKLSLLVEPHYTHYLNKSSQVADWTKQWALMLGVRYGF